jgi:hypothetical protein
MERFSGKVAKKLDAYVYRLIDPRDGNTFYVGKGRGNRVFAHVKDALKDYEGENFLEKDDDGVEEDDVSAKIQTIRKIHDAGLEVVHVIQRHGMDDDTAFEVEAALIEAYPGLTNKADGHDNSDRGVMNVKQVTSLYEAEEIKFTDDNCLIIKIRHATVETCGSVYEAVRSSWRLNISRAEKADYILATEAGLVTGVFTATAWYAATPENVAKHGGGINEGRYSFYGTEAPKDVQARYLGKRLPASYINAHAAMPIRYAHP